MATMVSRSALSQSAADAWATVVVAGSAFLPLRPQSWGQRAMAAVSARRR